MDLQFIFSAKVPDDATPVELPSGHGAFVLQVLHDTQYQHYQHTIEFVWGKSLVAKMEKDSNFSKQDLEFPQHLSPKMYLSACFCLLVLIGATDETLQALGNSILRKDRKFGGRNVRLAINNCLRSVSSELEDEPVHNAILSKMSSIIEEKVWLAYKNRDQLFLSPNKTRS